MFFYLNGFFSEFGDFLETGLGGELRMGSDGEVIKKTAVSEEGETLVMDHGGNMPDAAHPDEMEPRRA